MTTNRTPPRRRHTPAQPRARKDRGQHRPSRSDRRAIAAEAAEAAAVTQWDLPARWDSPTPVTPAWARDEGWAEKGRWAGLPQARRKRRPWLRTTLIAVAAFVAGGIFGAAAVTGRAPAASSTAAVNADADADAAAQLTPTPAAPAPSAAAAAPAPAAAGPTPTAPKDGMNVVNRDVSPGHYRTTGGSGGCYWERLRSTSGGAGDVITNAFVTGPMVVTIESSDAAFMSQGCGTWTPVG